MSAQELLNYWQVIKKRLWLIGLVAGVTMGTVAFISYFAKPLYRATASFQVTAPLPIEVSLTNEFRSPTSREELNFTRNNFVVLLENEFVAGQVIKELGLDTDPEKLLGQVVIEPDTSSDFVKLRVTAHDPKMAADIANGLVETAAQYFGELNAASFTANKEVIQQLLEERKKELDVVRAALVQFQIDNKVGSLDGLLASQEKLITTAKENKDWALAEGKLDVVASYDKIIALREKELQERLGLSAEYGSLLANMKRIEATYFALLDKETEVELKESEILSARFVRVIPARAPSTPLPSLDPRLLLIAGVTSLALGIILAFGMEYVETTRKTGAVSEAKTVPASQHPLGA